MPIRYDKSTAHLSGVCSPEETLDLVEWLRARKAPRVALKECAHMHTSILQALLAFKPKIVSMTEDDFLAAWVAPILEGGNRS